MTKIDALHTQLATALDNLMAAVLDRYIAEQNKRPKAVIKKFDAALRVAMGGGRDALAAFGKEQS